MVTKSQAAILTGAAGALVVGGMVYRKVSKASGKKKFKGKRNNKNTRKGSAMRRRTTPHTAGKRKDTSRRRIRYTKNGQPYIILASGKAKFITLKSAGLSHRRKGGRY